MPPTTIPLCQLDAFAGELFRGNPAAVCPLESWLDDALMQSIAAENNLSETAFLVRDGEDGFGLRWFTPAAEVELCGHATLASAWVAFHRLGIEADRVRFESASGTLWVRREGELLVLDFPARPGVPCAGPPGLAEGLGSRPVEVLEAPYYLAVFDTEAEVRELRPDPRVLAEVGRAVIVTAPGDEVDFVSRFFAPGLGIDEDPVTGSAHCTLTPYWSARLGRRELTAHQVSQRGGELRCVDRGERIEIGGRVVLYLDGLIHLP